MASRAITMLGMHRSGTSLVTRGISTLGIHIGENLIDKGQDNPTGFWEDKSLHLLSERVMKFFALKWNSTRFITPGQWGKKSHQAYDLLRQWLDLQLDRKVTGARVMFGGASPKQILKNLVWCWNRGGCRGNGV